VITQIKTAFKQRINEKTWLDNTTKIKVIGKVYDYIMYYSNNWLYIFMAQVDAITKQIAYPDFIKIDSELDSYYSQVS